MSLPALLALLLAAEPPVRYGGAEPFRASALEEEALEALRPRLGAGLAVAPELSRAARALAARPSPEKADRADLRLALAEAGAFDPLAALFTISGPRSELPSALRRALRDVEANRVGLGVVDRGDHVRAVLLLSQREVALSPVARDHAPGARLVLRGELLDGLRQPQLFVADPAGRARPLAAGGDRHFQAELDLDRPGRWLLEVLGTGPGGPRIVALLPLSVGGASLAEPPRPSAPEPGDPAAAEAQVLEAVNQLRARHGLAPLRRNPALQAVARRFSAAMAEQRRVAHRLADGRDAPERLRLAKIPFRRVLENLARESGALAAHASLEESPAHLANLLAPEVEQAGIGVARERQGGAPVTYLTELFVQPVDDSSDSRLRPEARVREVLWRERKRRGQAELISDPRLDALAGRAARAMLRADDPGLPGLDQEALGLKRQLAAVDSFVASSPELAAKSGNVGDARLHRVGIGVAIGDSPRYGAGLLWIAVVYTD